MSDYHGVVYTRGWVVDLILDIAGYTSDKPLWQQVVVEPSCGEGSFLVRIVNRLIESARRDGHLHVEDIRGAIVGYELDAESAEHSKLAIFDTLVANGLSADEAGELCEAWVRCEDYLLAPSVRCDYVIGNPPYLRSTEIDPVAREHYCARYSTMTRGCDIYVAFIQHGLETLREGGNLSFICADRWMQNQYGRSLRGFVAYNYHISAIVRMHGVDAFEADVSAYPSITRIDTCKGQIAYADCLPSFGEGDVSELWRWITSDQGDYTGANFSATRFGQPVGNEVLPLASPERVRLVTKVMEVMPSLEESGVRIGIGLATGRDSVFITDVEGLVEPERMLPAFDMRDWRRGRRDKKRWLVNPWDDDNTLIDLDDWPMTKRYFEEHRGDLARRHVARKDPRSWYRTIDKPNWSILGRPMLLFPDMATSADPVFSDGSRYPCHNCYWLVSDTWDLEVLGGLLMSEVAEAFIDTLGVKMRGGTLRFQAQYLRMIHVPDPASIPPDVCDRLRTAFTNNDRRAASAAARLAYGLEG